MEKRLSVREAGLWFRLNRTVIAHGCLAVVCFTGIGVILGWGY